MAAHKNLNTDLGLLAPRGKVAVIGNRSETVINARQLMATEGAVFGIPDNHLITSSYIHLLGVALGLSTETELSEFGRNIVTFLKETANRPVINKEYPLEELGKAHKDILSNTGARGNLVIRID